MDNPNSPELFFAEHDEQVKAFINQHRQMLFTCLDGITEEEARRRLVPSRTTLLGLVKHGTFVEKVWFREAPTGSSREALGIAPNPDESFKLEDGDNIASVIAEYREEIAHTHQVLEGATGETVFPGNKRGPLPLRWIQLHMLRELAQHCGHADILREQVLAARNASP